LNSSFLLNTSLTKPERILPRKLIFIKLTNKISIEWILNKNKLLIKKLRTIVNVLFAVLNKQYNGAVIQKQENIYVMLVAVNKEKKLQRRENQKFNRKVLKK